MTRWTIIFFLTTVFSSTVLQGQTDSDITKNIIYIGGGRQGLTYIKYERLLYFADWTQTVINLGVGGIPGDAEYGIPRTNKIMPQVGQLFGYKIIFLEVGLEPSINFYGKTTYIDLNAILGLRYQSRTKQLGGLFFQTGYNPRLFHTFNSDIYAPFYFGLGLNF
jgi:hypothetical protein